MKGKSQQQIVILKKMEKTIEQQYTAYKAWYLNMLDGKKLLPLLPLVYNNETEEKKPLEAWLLPENDSLESGKRIVTLFTDAMTATDILLLLDSGSIRRHANLVEIKLLPATVPANLVLCDLLFEFPEPLNLTAQQVQIVRNELSSAVWPLMDELAMLCSEIQKLSFTENNFSSLVALYTEKTGALKAKVQEAIGSNQYLNRLKTETKKTGRLWMGISSFHTIFDLYRQQGIIDLGSEAYSKEEAARTVDLNNARAFLFLETIENEN